MKKKFLIDFIVNKHWKDVWTFRKEGLFILDKETRKVIAFYKDL